MCCFQPAAAHALIADRGMPCAQTVGRGVAALALTLALAMAPGARMVQGAPSAIVVVDLVTGSPATQDVLAVQVRQGP
jgi:hypothetical protein